MRVDLFDFELPQERIALRPAVPRDSSRLLHVQPAKPFEDRVFRDLPDLLHPGDLLVFNDTRVIPAQLYGLRIRDQQSRSISVTLHMRVDEKRWKAFAKPAKRLEKGDLLIFSSGEDAGTEHDLTGAVENKGADGEIDILFDLAGADLDAAIAAAGHVPLPPYIASKRRDDERDRTDYQTTYACQDGAVAAPTAGLHFTPELINTLEVNGISICYITLHVGAGTFLPVKAEDTDDHKMHSEIGYISENAASLITRTRKGGGRVISVGTTSLRLLESAAHEDGTVKPWSGPTDIFITPGYRFKVVDGLITNFHLPRSTLFMLVSAFSGIETMRAAYDHAIANEYRFYSYGDSSLLWREDLE